MYKIKPNKKHEEFLKKRHSKKYASVDLDNEKLYFFVENELASKTYDSLNEIFNALSGKGIVVPLLEEAVEIGLSIEIERWPIYSVINEGYFEENWRLGEILKVNGQKDIRKF